MSFVTRPNELEIELRMRFQYNTCALKSKHIQCTCYMDTGTENKKNYFTIMLQCAAKLFVGNILPIYYGYNGFFSLLCVV